jgi:hypothetical protein
MTLAESIRSQEVALRKTQRGRSALVRGVLKRHVASNKAAGHVDVAWDGAGIWQ